MTTNNKRWLVINLRYREESANTRVDSYTSETIVSRYTQIIVVLRLVQVGLVRRPRVPISQARQFGQCTCLHMSVWCMLVFWPFVAPKSVLNDDRQISLFNTIIYFAFTIINNIQGRVRIVYCSSRSQNEVNQCVWPSFVACELAPRCVCTHGYLDPKRGQFQIISKENENQISGADPGFCEGGFEGGFVDSLKGTFEQK